MDKAVETTQMEVDGFFAIYDSLNEEQREEAHKQLNWRPPQTQSQLTRAQSKRPSAEGK